MTKLNQATGDIVPLTIAADLDPARLAYCAVKEERERYVATLTVAVDRHATVAEAGHMPPPPPPGMHAPGAPPEGSHGRLRDVRM